MFIFGADASFLLTRMCLFLRAIAAHASCRRVVADDGADPVCRQHPCINAIPCIGTPSSHSKNSATKICSKGWVAQKPFADR